MLCAIVMLTALAAEATAPPEIQLHRSQLDNGIRLVLAQVENAQSQTTFTFLPLTIANDDKDRSQWSHLLEHMLIRTTDPLELHAEGVTFNGETTSMYLRMETFAQPAKWKEALQRLAKWLNARAFDPQSLAREKANIQLEEQSTAAQCYTGKFALAAWNQVVRHGAPHASVHGDVANATVEAVQQYAADKVPFDDSMTIASIGPAPVEEVRAEIQRLLGTAERKTIALQSAEREGGIVGKSFRATWDFPTRHAKWFWKLPDREPTTLAAAAIVGQAIHTFFFTDPKLRGAIRQVGVNPAVRVPEGTYLIVDCCLPDGGKAEEVWSMLKPAIVQLAEGGARRPLLGMTGPMIAQQLDPAPDLAAWRQQLPPAMRDNAEGVWLLSSLNFEYPWGTKASEIHALLATPDKKAIDVVLDALISAEPATLTLEPTRQPATAPASGE